MYLGDRPANFLYRVRALDDSTDLDQLPALAALLASQGAVVPVKALQALLPAEPAGPAAPPLVRLVLRARALGIALEIAACEASALASLPHPFVVGIRDGGRVRFATVSRHSQASLHLVGGMWPTGVDLGWDEFSASWIGVCALPTFDRVVLGRITGPGLSPASVLWRAAWRAGLQPPYRQRLAGLSLMLALLALPLIVLGVSAWTATVVLGLALSASASGWLAAFGATCATCKAASNEVGALPLDRIGVVVYGGAIGVALARPPGAPMLLAFVLGLALGGHAVLLHKLRAARTACAWCLAAACGVVLALGGLAYAQPWVLVAVAPLAAIGGYATARLASAATRLRELRYAAGSHALAREVVRALPPPPPGRATMVVYKKADCPPCILYETFVAPIIEDEFADELSVQTRDLASNETFTPLAIVVGARAFAAVEPTAEDLRLAIKAALRPASPDDPPGLQWLASSRV